MKIFRRGWTVVLTISILLLLLSPLFAGEEKKAAVFPSMEITVVRPATALNSDIEPGLDVIYYKNFYRRHLRHLPKGDSVKYPSFKGKPIFHINHQFGKEEVFDSGENRGIGMRMTGYLDLARPGIYEFQALSNDGIIFAIDGQTVLSDPGQHSDTLSNIGRVTVQTAGWYPVMIEYFQRKGTATLKLFWKNPSSQEFIPVPGKAYGHMP